MEWSLIVSVFVGLSLLNVLFLLYNKHYAYKLLVDFMHLQINN